MGTITMYDSVNPQALPAGGDAYAGYVDGAFNDFARIRERFPKAHLLSITVFASVDADCLDIETGDATPDQAPSWVRRQHARGLAEPCLYANASTMPSVIAALDRAGIHRSEYRLWVAKYDGIAVIPAGFDAKQYEERRAQDIDVSVCAEDFFGPAHPPYAPADEKRWEREWDRLRRRRGPWPALRRRVLKRVMVHRERQIVSLAAQSGWGIRNRRDRYRKLLSRTGQR